MNNTQQEPFEWHRITDQPDLAECVAIAPPGSLGDYNCMDWIDCMTVENANLVAAAPKLLAACHMWLKFNSETWAENPCPDVALRARYREEAVKLSMDAIAKIEGTTP